MEQSLACSICPCVGSCSKPFPGQDLVLCKAPGTHRYKAKSSPSTDPTQGKQTRKQRFK